MARHELHPIREAPLTNNCPLCFNQDLTLRFFQKHAYTRLYHRVTSEVAEELHCNTCQSRVYPVTWTEDIERSVEYYRKAIAPEKAGIRFRPLFYILVLLGIALAAAGVYLYLQGAIRA